jgi:flagellar protein FliS
MSNAYTAYQQSEQSWREAEILSADPVELVRILYRGALDAVREARTYLQRGEIRLRSQQITKASLILNELLTSLDQERGGEMSHRLALLYDYMQHLLLTANTQQVEAPLQEVEGLLSTLLEAWQRCSPGSASPAAG